MLPLSLAGKTALITGASRKIGIGAAIARMLAQAGADVYLTYFRPYDASMAWGSQPDEVSQLLEELRALGRRAAGHEADLSQPIAPRQVIEAALQTFDRLDILINNAAFDIEVGIDGLDADLLDLHYAVNLRAPALLCREFLARYDSRPGGRIVNLTTGQGQWPMPDNLAYAVTKGGLESLTMNLAPEAARKNVTINAIDPGPTDTGWMTDEQQQTLQSQGPFGRVGLPEDAAGLALFLCSDYGGWITGQVLHARGGF